MERPSGSNPQHVWNRSHANTVQAEEVPDVRISSKESLILSGLVMTQNVVQRPGLTQQQCSATSRLKLKSHDSKSILVIPVQSLTQN